MRLRTAVGVAAASCLGAGAAAVAAGRYASCFALDPHAGHASQDGEPVTVHRVAPGRITLTRSLATARRGVFGLAGDDFHATVGAVLETTPDSVTRQLTEVRHGEPTAGAHARLTPRVHTGNPYDAVGLEYAEDPVEGELGYLPAWFVPGARATWVITVHGLGATREQPLAVLPVLHRLGFPVLDVSLPQRPRRPALPRPHRAPRRHRVARRGRRPPARRALRRRTRDPLRLVHRRHHGAAHRRPLAAARPGGRTGAGLPGARLAGHWSARVVREHRCPACCCRSPSGPSPGRTGLSADRLAASADPGRLRVPVFAAHGPDDSVAPWRATRALADRRPDLVTLHTVRDAAHQAVWNADPPGYEETLRRFLTPLM